MNSFRKDYAEGIDVGERALALNPNDVELKGDFGHRLALFGDWDKGCRLVKEALDSSARKIGYYKTVLALCDFYKNDVQADFQYGGSLPGGGMGTPTFFINGRKIAGAYPFEKFDEMIKAALAEAEKAPTKKRR